MASKECNSCRIGEGLRSMVCLMVLGAMGTSDGKMLEVWRCPVCGAMYSWIQEEEEK